MIKKMFKLGILLFSICWVTLSWAALPEFTDLAARAGKAVVNIGTVKVVKRPDIRGFFRGLPQNHPFEDFFDQFEKFFGQQFSRPQKQRSLGSGFIISRDGYIVTNNHVIEGADEIKVKFQDKHGDKTYDAKIVGTDPETDLALLKIDADTDLPTLKFGDSDKIKVGQWVVAIGNPFGLDHTVTAGIVSAKGRIIGAGPYDNFIQTDASINPGNSGGPLLNLKGEVIGINTAIIASGQGIGFAIPSNLAKNVIEQLKKHKKVKRGWLGVSIQNLDENSAKALGLEAPKGALVASVTPGDPADKAGVKAGDVIIAVEGKVVENASDLTRKIGELLPGTKIKITIWRKGTVKDVYVTLGERSLHKLAQNGRPESEVEESVLGLSLRSVRPEEARALGLDKVRGLLVTGVHDGSKAALNDVRPGDVILEANGQEVNTVSEFKRIFETDAKKKKVLMLLIKRNGQNVFRTISLEED